MRRVPLLALLLLLATFAHAHADEVARKSPLEGQPTISAGETTGAWQDISGDSRRIGSDDIVGKRSELEIASEMVFLTSRGAMAGVPELFFTDVGLWRTRVAYTPLPRLRLTGAVGFAAKQPSTIDERFWQSAALGVHFNTSARTALALDLELGSMLARSGIHGSAGLGLQARKRMNEFISWEGRLGASATSLWFDQRTDEPFWFAEAGGSGEVQFCWGPCRYRYGASWFAIDLAVPVFHHPGDPDPATGLALDPRTRLGVTLGSFFNVTGHWDMYVTVRWVDRGDAEKPATQLPILDGGFDQVQLGIGLIVHFSLEACGPEDRDPECREARRQGYE